MNSKTRLTISLVGLFAAVFSYGQTEKKNTSYLGIVGPIVFDAVSYNLAWSSHPSNNYYREEYIPSGQPVEKFKKLIIVEVITGETKVEDIVALKVAELIKIKKSNPVVNYEKFE